ncbi:MAG: FG-GAP repeat protein [Planctomycetes bacterium]|nr:FG-GAP repeat protein [Planctomycetota bacterium]
MKPLAAIASLAILALPASAQKEVPAPAKDPVGGSVSTIHELYASSNTHHFYGDSISGAGDVDGDDVPDFIIGEWGANSNHGTVYVHSGATGAVLHRFHGQAYQDRLGWDVAAAGDVDADGFDDIAATAPGAAAANVYSGATGALLFRFTGSTISGAGDVDGDSHADVMVGHRSAYNVPGVVTVYSGADGSQIFQFVGASNDVNLGSSVASAGDLDGDGLPDFLIAASAASPGGIFRAGSVFVYSSANGNLLYQFDGTTDQESFGFDISAAGDVNADGFDDIIIGSPNAYGDSWSGGAAFVYSGQSGELLHLFPGQFFPYSGTWDSAGWSVAGVGDVNNDDFADLLVGAPFSSVEGNLYVGSITLYSGATGERLHQKFGQLAEEQMGEEASYIGDVNQDGFPDLLFAAVGWDGGWFYSESTVYVLSFNQHMISDTKTIFASSGGSIALQLDFLDASAHYDYKILLSASGKGPMHYGVDIPLGEDQWVHDSIFGIYPFTNHSNLHGTLNSHGQAAASITLPPGLPGSLIGQTFYFAAIANVPGQLPEFSSIGVPVRVIP